MISQKIVDVSVACDALIVKLVPVTLADTQSALGLTTVPSA